MHLLDDLEECSVKLGEDLIAVFKLKANVVGLHPCYVLNRAEAGRKCVYVIKNRDKYKLSNNIPPNRFNTRL